LQSSQLWICDCSIVCGDFYLFTLIDLFTGLIHGFRFLAGAFQHWGVSLVYVESTWGHEGVWGLAEFMVRSKELWLRGSSSHHYFFPLWLLHLLSVISQIKCRMLCMDHLRVVSPKSNLISPTRKYIIDLLLASSKMLILTTLCDWLYCIVSSVLLKKLKWQKSNFAPYAHIISFHIKGLWKIECGWARRTSCCFGAGPFYLRIRSSKLISLTSYRRRLVPNLDVVVVAASGQRSSRSTLHVLSPSRRRHFLSSNVDRTLFPTSWRPSLSPLPPSLLFPVSSDWPSTAREYRVILP